MENILELPPQRRRLVQVELVQDPELLERQHRHSL